MVTSFEQFCAGASKGSFVPVTQEIVLDADTPVSVLAKFYQSDRGFLLESVVGGKQWAEYSFLGVGFLAEISWQSSGRAKVEWLRENRVQEIHAADPCTVVNQILDELEPATVEDLPRFWGGAVGWFAYECIEPFSPKSVLTRLHASPGAEPDTKQGTKQGTKQDTKQGSEGTQKATDKAVGNEVAASFVFADEVIVFDNLRQTVKIIVSVDVRDASDSRQLKSCYQLGLGRVAEVEATVRKQSSLPRLPPMSPAPSMSSARDTNDDGPRWTHHTSNVEYKKSVQRIQDYIVAGDIFQCVLSQAMSCQGSDIEGFHIYRALRVGNPSPYMYWLKTSSGEVIGASPETLVRRVGNKAMVRPIAGTRARGATTALDNALEKELVNDSKEQAEHLMLLDLGRNDIGRVSLPGTVECTRYMQVERYSHVMHMVSEVEGTLRQDCSWPDALRAAFPAGTLSGAPKIRAMEIIEELEPVPRGVYGGAVGYVSFSRDMDFAIAIRTVVKKKDNLRIQAGAGIVFDSDPQKEYQETLDKLAAVTAAVEVANKISQTDQQTTPGEEE